ncbi:plastocyanin/azurin family copper-binding protein [Emticicia sp. BO119]|uniref:plastocyanin/azurin family copper-binding protein n=1 Tax=Emticicia sp. BO119 TaxID=2757768 RepID=UPI001E57C02A|nr:plastocyanin/azurin family copper-binding protein [Emticicia sp. BO119]
MSAQQDTTIVIKVLGGLQFDLPRFAVRPNTRVTITLDNHDDMAHNLVVTQPNSRIKVVDEALKLAEKGAKMDYIPNSPLVIAHTRILEPGRMESITFLVDKEGTYPYVCTYPGHGYIMYGAMYVTTKPLPPLEKDLNVPETQRQKTGATANHSGHHMASQSPHPYPLKYPLHYRTFMPDCSPAAIAVALNETESYCFDAGKCYLRYAWSGGFVDNSEQWKGNGSKLTKIVGDIYWHDNTGFPFRIGKIDITPEVHFKGYHLTNRIPTFRYLLNNIEVKETLTLLPGDTGLSRTFTFRNNTQPLLFIIKTDDGITYKSSVGKFNDGVLTIPAGTQKLTLTMKK